MASQSGASEGGTLNLDTLGRLVDSDDVDTVVVMFTDLYGRFVGKRFDAEFFLDSVANAGTHACNYLLTVDMEMEPVPGYRFANWEQGYGDIHLVPDLTTLARASWLDRTALVVCDVQHQRDHRPVAPAPRTILRQQVQRAEEMGLRFLGASELEYYIFRNSYRQAAQNGHRDLTPAGWYIEDYHTLQGSRVEDFNAAARHHLKASGIPVECTKGEWGLGQHELNLRYCDVLVMADRHAILKQCLKELADAKEMAVTFMAKLATDQAGSSCHIHLSLWQGDRNAFVGDRCYGTVEGSESLGHFVAGWIGALPELMVLLAPNVNSYKRYRSGSWAPTRLAWSHDNRTAGIRVVGEGDSLRLECRLPGADCNPYLAYAALLAAGLEGIRRELPPPDIFSGDAYATTEAPRIPRTLHEAVLLFETSELARNVLGDEVVDHYVHFFTMEQHAADQAVTDWERQRYFERI